jgi:hypothetical protein
VPPARPLFGLEQASAFCLLRLQMTSYPLACALMAAVAHHPAAHLPSVFAATDVTIVATNEAHKPGVRCQLCTCLLRHAHENAPLTRSVTR